MISLSSNIIYIYYYKSYYIYTLHAWNRWKKCTVSTKTTDSWLVDVKCIHCGQPQIWWLLVAKCGFNMVHSIWFNHFNRKCLLLELSHVFVGLVWFGLFVFGLFLCLFLYLCWDVTPCPLHVTAHSSAQTVSHATVLIVLWLKLGQDRLKATELNGGTEWLDWLDCRHWVTELITLCCIYVKLPLQFCSCLFVRSFVCLCVFSFVGLGWVEAFIWLWVFVSFSVCSCFSLLIGLSALSVHLWFVNVGAPSPLFAPK